MFPGYTKILLDEVMPIVDKAYNVSKNREQRAIAGLSMGGAETLYVGLNNLDKFAWIGAFSSAPMSCGTAAMPNAADAAAAVRARRGGRGAGRPADDGRRGLREDVSNARREGQFADSDAVDRVRHRRRPDRREPPVQGLAADRRTCSSPSRKCPTSATSGRSGVRTSPTWCRGCFRPKVSP